MAGEITLTSKMGTFTFDRRVVISKAKLIRDSITGQFFNPKSDERSIKRASDIEPYVRAHLSKQLNEIWFEVTLNPILAGV